MERISSEPLRLGALLSGEEWFEGGVAFHA